MQAVSESNQGEEEFVHTRQRQRDGGVGECILEPFQGVPVVGQPDTGWNFCKVAEHLQGSIRVSSVGTQAG